MTTRFAALCAIAALALGACAPLAVGGEWSTATPITREGWLVAQPSLRFDPSGSVVISATVRPAQASSSCVAARGTLTGRWFVNARGQTVVSAPETACLDHPTTTCDGAVMNPCAGAATLVTIYNDRGDALVSSDGQVVLTRTPTAR